MPLQEVMLVNRRGWRRRNPMSVSGTLNDFKAQFQSTGGIKGIGSALAGFAVCSAWLPRSRFLARYGRGWGGPVIAGVSAIVGGIVLNRFVKDKTVAVGFTTGGLVGAGGMVIKRLFPKVGGYFPGVAGLGTGTGLYNEELFGLGETDEDVLMGAEYLTPEYSGERTLRFDDAAIENVGAAGEDVDPYTLIPTMTGLE